MKVTLTPKEAEMAIAFLNRVELKGAESEAHASVKMKLHQIRAGAEMPTNVTDLEGVTGRGTTD